MVSGEDAQCHLKRDVASVLRGVNLSSSASEVLCFRLSMYSGLLRRDNGADLDFHAAVERMRLVASEESGRRDKSTSSISMPEISYTIVLSYYLDCLDQNPRWQPFLCSHRQLPKPCSSLASDLHMTHH
jgi:hypothetical protein